MKSTKKSLFLSTISLILCFAMLLGTTYAWFTDSVTSGKNQIIAGNLDVELYANGTKVDGNTKLFSKVELWEPGAVAFDTLQVKNVGNLALKYQLSFLFENETKVDGHGLSEVLKIGTYEGEITDSTKREDVIAGLTDVVPIASFAKSGNLAANTDDTAVTYVVYWEPGDNDNLYNMNNEKKGKELSIDFYVKLVATQDTVEADSFDKNYDIEAPWLGGVGELPEAKDGVIEIASAEQLAALSSAADSAVSGKTVKLVKDIDLNNIEWKPVTKGSISWTFDGNSHTILNLKVTSNQRGNGLFSWCPGLTVKDLTVDGAKISGTGMDGVIAGNGSCIKVDKCTVRNAEVISNPNIKDADGDYNGDKSGIIVGYLCADPTTATVTNCVVEDSKITGYRQCGGIVGVLNGAEASATGNKAKNIDITIDASNNYKGFEKQEDFNMHGDIGQVLSGTATDNTATEGIKITLVYADGLIAVSDNNFEISTANGLKAFAKLATEAKDPGYPNQKTINAKVTADLDATGVDWKNVVLVPKARVSVHIDGNGKSISHINVTDEGKVALFASAGSDKNSGATMTIKDFTVKESTFVSTKYVDANDGTAAFIGNLAGECSMTNCTVKDCALTTQKYAGGFIGYDAHGSSTPVFTNCTVDGLTLTSTATSGSTSLGGFLGYSQCGYMINGLDVKNVTNNGADGATVYYGLYFGTPNATMTLTDCKQSSGLAGRFETNIH